jgi:hypothetical protein
VTGLAGAGVAVDSDVGVDMTAAVGDVVGIGADCGAAVGGAAGAAQPIVSRLIKTRQVM